MPQYAKFTWHNNGIKFSLFSVYPCIAIKSFGYYECHHQNQIDALANCLFGNISAKCQNIKPKVQVDSNFIFILFGALPSLFFFFWLLVFVGYIQCESVRVLVRVPFCQLVKCSFGDWQKKRGTNIWSQQEKWPVNVLSYRWIVEMC